jgi:hypothetical protein
MRYWLESTGIDKINMEALGLYFGYERVVIHRDPELCSDGVTITPVGIQAIFSQGSRDNAVVDGHHLAFKDPTEQLLRDLQVAELKKAPRNVQ